MPPRLPVVSALAVAGLALLVAACQHDTQPPRLPLVGAASVSADRSACVKRGGHFQAAPVGKGAMICISQPRDAGNTCSRASDCEGACLAISRTCSPLIPLLGCQDILTDSGARMTQCVN